MHASRPDAFCKVREQVQGIAGGTAGGAAHVQIAAVHGKGKKGKEVKGQRLRRAHAS